MKFFSKIGFAALIFAGANLASAQQTAWVGDRSSATALDLSGGSVQLSKSFPNIVDTSEDANGDFWLLSSTSLIEVQASGSVQLWPLAALGLPSASHLASASFDHTVWVTDGTHIKHIDGQGHFLGNAASAAPIADMAVGLDGSLWVLSDSQLTQFSGSGRLLGNMSTSGAAFAGSHRKVAIDSVRNVAWLRSDTQMNQIDLKSGVISHIAGPPLTIISSVLDPVTGTFWLLTDSALVKQLPSGSQSQIALSSLSVTNATLLGFDVSSSTVWIAQPNLVTKFHPLTNTSDQLPTDVSPLTLALPGFSVQPAMAYSAPSAAASAPLMLSLSTLCNGVACTLAPTYFQGFGVKGLLGGQDVAGAFAVNGTAKVATYQGADSFGSHPLLEVQGIDRFGAVSNVVSTSVTDDTVGNPIAKTAKPLVSGVVVSLTAPTSGAGYLAPATVPLSATASSSGKTISNVKFYNGSTLLATDTASPYTYSWTPVGAGTYSLTAVATDSSSATGTSAAVPISVYTAPTVSLTSPAIGAPFNIPATVALAASASDTDATISSVQFYNGSSLVGTATTSPYTYSWGVTTAGNYSVTAKATNNFGASASSSPLVVKVDALPVVSISAPASAAVYETPATVTIIAVPTDAVGNISKVDFYQGTTLLGTVTSSPYTYTWSAGSSTGSFSLTAKATNDAGGVTTSAAVPITIDATPTVTLTSPPASAVFEDQGTVTLTATTSDAVGTIKNVAFYQGTTLLATVTSSPYTYSWTKVATGTYSITAKVTNNAGGVATSAAVPITVDAPPTVTLTSPTTAEVFEAPASVTFTATAADSVGVIKNVAFYQGTSLLATVTTAPYTYTWTSVATGAYSLSAKVTNDANTVVTSGTVAITVDTAPTIAISTPTANAVLNTTATIPITAAVSDTKGSISSVKFYDGSTLLGTVTASPWTWSWTGASPGAHTLTAAAANNGGGVTTSGGVAVTVDALPTVSITSPASAAKFNGPASIAINATAADTTGTISKVDFYQGSTKIGTSTTSPYTYTWTNVAGGSYTLTAIATNNGGGTQTSTAVPITVYAAPSVALTSPTAGSVYELSASIGLAATATDSNSTVSSVGFYSGSTLLGTAASAPYTYTWTPATAGTYSLTAKATNAVGQVTTSSSVGVTVDSAPTVILSSPTASSTYNSPANVTLTAVPTEKTGAVSSVAFYNGSTLLSTITASPYTYIWPSVPSGTYTVKAVVTNNAGTQASSSPVTFNVDAAPSVSITSPASNSVFTTAGTIPLSATAAESIGTIASVAYYQGSTLIGSTTAAPYNFSWANPAAGTYSITAVATDNAGGTTTSAPIAVTIYPPPTVAITAPISGAIVASGATSVTLTASASSPNGSASRVDFYNGSTLLGSATSSPFSYTLSNPPPGSYNFTAKVTDSVGATAFSSLVYTPIDSPDTCSGPQAKNELAPRQLLAQRRAIDLTFEPNLGQTEPEIAYFSRRGKSQASITASGLTVQGGAGLTNAQATFMPIHTARSELLAEDKVEEISNYLDQGTPSKSLVGVPHYKQVRRKELYPGIDQLFYSKDGNVEYDFDVGPGADPHAIVVELQNAKGTITAEGALALTSDNGTLLEQTKPVAYQLVDGRRIEVAASYRIVGKEVFGFDVGSYDPSSPLIIDPIITYSSYGVQGYAAAVTHCGELMMADGPTLTKLNAAGTALIYTTSIVGTYATALATDSSGRAYVTGTAVSGTSGTPGAFQTVTPASGTSPIYVAAVSSDGSALLYSTFNSGSNPDAPTSIAVDSTGAAYVTGKTYSTDFPTTTGAFQSTFPSPGYTQTSAFVTKLAPNGSHQIYSTYIGSAIASNVTGSIGSSIALDAAGNVYLAGISGGNGFPVTAAPIYSSGTNFALKLNPTGTGLVYSTYMPTANATAVDSSAAQYVVGSAGEEYPTATVHVFDVDDANGGVWNNSVDATLYKLLPDGSALSFTAQWGSPYLAYAGAINRTTTGLYLGVDTSGNSYVVGTTNSEDFQQILPVIQTKLQTTGGGYNQPPPLTFVTKVNSTGTALVYQDLIGDPSTGNMIVTSNPTGAAFTPAGDVYVTGNTTSSTGSFTTTPGTYTGQVFGNEYGGFFIQLNGVQDTTTTVSSSLPSPSVGQTVNAIATIQGDHPTATGTVTFTNGSTVLGTAPVSGLTATLDISSLPGGIYSIVASYSGDSNNNPSVSIAYVLDKSDRAVLPTVTITTPDGTSSSSFTTSGIPVSFSYAAGAGNVIESMELTDNNNAYTIGITPGLASYSSNVRMPGNIGSHTYRAEVTDNYGNNAFSNYVTVLSENTTAPPPTVSLTAPTITTATIGQSVPLNATVAATATGATISQTEYFANGSPIFSSSNPANVAGTWKPTAAGTYVIQAIVYDSNSNSTASNSVTVTVAPSENPTVAIVSPGATEFVAPTSVTLVANAAPGVGRTIASVAFFNNGTTLLGTVTAAPYVLTLPSTTVGNYLVTAVVTDSTGVTATSAVAGFTVQAVDNTPGEVVTFIHTDLGGSPIAATNEQGTVLWREAYTPFGARLTNATQAASNREFFHNKPADPESGLSYFGARYYDPVIGRFMGDDPKGFDDKHVQSFGRYTYGNNNPYAYRDPDGKFAFLIPLAEIATENAVAFALGTAGGLIVGDTLWNLTHNDATLGISSTPIKAEQATEPASVPSAQNGEKKSGSYTNTHESGKTYDGKGGRERSQDSGKRVEAETGDPHVATEWRPAASDREAFKDESRNLDRNGGANSESNYNKINSPGSKLRKQDGEP